MLLDLWGLLSRRFTRRSIAISGAPLSVGLSAAPRTISIEGSL